MADERFPFGLAHSPAVHDKPIQAGPQGQQSHDRRIDACLGLAESKSSSRRPQTPAPRPQPRPARAFSLRTAPIRRRSDQWSGHGRQAETCLISASSAVTSASGSWPGQRLLTSYPKSRPNKRLRSHNAATARLAPASAVAAGRRPKIQISHGFSLRSTASGDARNICGLRYSRRNRYQCRNSRRRTRSL